jgi:hypothetical protein
MFVALLLACGAASPDAPTADPAPAAPRPLAEVLYAGELGASARPAGDRVRMVVWLTHLDPNPEQLATLRDQGLAVQALHADAQARIDAIAEAERVALEPLYAELQAELLTGTVDADAWAARLEQARPPQDPRRVRVETVDATLSAADAVLAGWSTAQLESLGDALFVLRPELSPGMAPAAYQGVLGRPWDPGDFATLRRSASPADPDPLDPGALFTLEQGERSVIEGLGREQAAVILALVLAHPALPEACDALLGAPE